MNRGTMYKASARVIGILFIVASVAAIVGGSILVVLEDATFLGEAVDKDAEVAIGVLLELVLALSVLGIAAAFVPILRTHNEGMAHGYLAARIYEGVLVVIGALAALVVLTLGQNQAASGEVEVLRDLLLSVREWVFVLGPMFMFSVSALILNAVLFRARLVPAWLSIWGFLGAALLLIESIIEMFGADFSGAMQAVFAAPIGIQEMVFALWLIVKGFTVTPAAVAASDQRHQPA